jgi:gliding motility-associated-like protein
MKFLLSIAALLIFTARISAQVNVCLGTDVTVCSGVAVNINLCPPAGAIPYLNADSSSVLIPTPNYITGLTDDVFSGVQTIGFPFTFYGVSYSQFVVSSNGYISFNIAQASGGSPWSISAAIPSTADPMNTIMAAWCDLNPSMSTTNVVATKTLGVAPNRICVIVWQNVPMFSCTSQTFTSSIVLHETTGLIDIGLNCMSTCATWNSGSAIQGVHKSTGTVATATPGRNFPTVWAVAQDGKRFTPSGGIYNVASIPFVAYVVPNNVTWNNTLGQVLVGQPNGSLALAAASIPSGTTGYFINYAVNNPNCSSGSLPLTSDTTFITRIIVNGTISNTPDICSSLVGTATVVPTQGTAPFTFLWTGGQTTATAVGLGSGIKTCVITDANGCTKTLTTTILDNPVNVTATGTLVSCPGGANGTATASVLPVIPGTTFNWYDGGGQTTQTATGLSAGIHHVAILTPAGCMDTAAVTITEIPAMVITLVSSTDVTCNSGSDGIVSVNVTLGTGPYTYAWDNTTQTTNPATTLPTGAQIVTVTDANGCIKTFTQTIGQPPALNINAISPLQTICEEADVDLGATGTGGSSPYIFTWLLNNQVVGTQDSITIPTTLPVGNYCLVLTEQCGSPADTLCTTVVWPPDIDPSFLTTHQVSPYGAGTCVPTDLKFWNTSPSTEIATIAWEFGDTHDAIAAFGDTVSNVYVNAGLYDVKLTLTSIYGCVYDSVFTNYVEGYAIPDASFGMSASPTTIFETDIRMVDVSSHNVVAWQWNIPGANPSSSNETNFWVKYPEGVIADYPVTLIVTTIHGCKDTVTKFAIVNNDILFYAPNSFTPDGDEFNQKWEFSLAGIDATDFELIIFNRWGQVIWETRDATVGWDGTFNGKIVELGTYNWKSTFKDINTDRRYQFTGSINVLK